MSEEDQMMRAIAMSLGQDIPMDQRAESPEVIHQPHSQHFMQSVWNNTGEALAGKPAGRRRLCGLRLELLGHNDKPKGVW